MGDNSLAAFRILIKEIPSEQREQSLEGANILLSWNFPREILPQEYPRLQQVTFIQLLSADADYVPFADLPSRIIVASNPGAYAAPMAEHVMAMTLALAKGLLIENQKLRNGEFDQFTPNRMLAGMTAGILGFGGSDVPLPGSCALLACASTRSIIAGQVPSRRNSSARCAI